MEQILDEQLAKNKIEHDLLTTIKWWESRRVFFNFSIGLAGVIPIFFFWHFLSNGNLYLLAFSSIIYVCIANVCYCVSWGIDVLRWYYLKDSNFGKYKELFLIAGIIFSVGLTMMFSAATWLSMEIGHF